MSPTRPAAFPARLALNAWDGHAGAVSAELAASSYAFARRTPSLDRRLFLAPDELADETDWRHETVGWGVILPDVDPATMPIAEQAKAADMPELAPLLEDRPGGAVFRYRRRLPPTHLQRCLPDGTVKDIDIAASMRGSAPDRLPAYLTIVAQPKDVPWSFQGALSTRASVGRLPLEGPQLANYVRHLVDGWNESPVQRKDVVVWGVDWGERDITRLLRRTIADPLAKEFRDDPGGEIDVRYLDGGARPDDGLAGALIATLEHNRPSLVITTSHGATLTTGDTATLAANLGLPLDQRRQMVRPEALLAQWEPDGAIWYAHACCGAGSSVLNEYRELVNGDERVISLLDAVSSLGDTVAPLPIALLGAEKPVRAFVGHVEPTFDWTLQQPSTGQVLTGSLVQGLYHELFQVKRPRPLGLAMRDWYSAAATHLVTWDKANTALNDGEIQASLLGALLAARDRLGQVILGDPTVLLPAPA